MYFQLKMLKITHLLHLGNQPNTSTTSMEDPPRVELPSNARGYPTPEALSIVLRHAARLLSGPATTSLSVNNLF
jgi:hypothetical protein